MEKRDLSAVLGDLPELAAVMPEGSDQPVVVKRGFTGYWSMPEGSTMAQINSAFEVTPQQQAAMLWGSLLGFDTPGADAQRYDDAGRLMPGRAA